MFRDDRHDGPELHVPEEALHKPRGAEVGADGKVACIACGERVALASADVVGQGYRCAPCGHRAEVAALQTGANVDAGAHLSRGARDDLRAQGRAMMIGGIAVIALGVAIAIGTLAAGWDSKLGFIVAGCGVGLAATGSMKKQAAG